MGLESSCGKTVSAQIPDTGLPTHRKIPNRCLRSISEDRGGIGNSLHIYSLIAEQLLGARSSISTGLMLLPTRRPFSLNSLTRLFCMQWLSGIPHSVCWGFSKQQIMSSFKSQEKKKKKKKRVKQSRSSISLITEYSSSNYSCLSYQYFASFYLLNYLVRLLFFHMHNEEFCWAFFS